MITFYPVPGDAAPFLGVGYALRSGREPLLFRLSALQPQVQLVLKGGLAQSIGQASGACLRRSPRLAVVGRSTAASLVAAEPHSRVVGVGLQSSAWKRATGTAAAEATDGMVEGAAIWGEAASARLLDRAEACGEDRAAVDLLSGFLLCQVRSRPSDDAARVAAVDAWMGTAPHATVDGLVSTMNLSRRQTERLSRMHYGVSPKLLERKYRILRIAAALALGETVLPAQERDSALSGFSDQSHFIRDFKQFTGFTPGRYGRDQAPLERALLLGRWQAGGRTPFTLWS